MRLNGRSWLVGFAIGAPLLFGVLVWTSRKIVLGRLSEGIIGEAVEIRAVLPRILADLEALRRSPPFPPSPRKADAGPYLSRHLSWSGAIGVMRQASAPKRLSTPSHEALREFAAAHPAWREGKPDLAPLLRDPRLARIDTRWLARLGEFDHWSIGSNAYIVAELERAARLGTLSRIGIRAGLPEPDFQELRLWALVHFLKLHREGRGREGLRAFRQVAVLAHSMGSLVGSISAVMLLRQEASLARSAGVAGWPSVPDAISEAYKRVSWAWPALLRLGASGIWLAELEPYLAPPYGMCGGVFTPHAIFLDLQGYFSPNVPGEVDFSPEIARARRFEERVQALCGLEFLAPLHAPVPAEARTLIIRGVNPWRLLNPSAAEPQASTARRRINPEVVPFVRQTVGLGLATVIMPRFLRFYQDEAATPPGRAPGVPGP